MAVLGHQGHPVAPGNPGVLQRKREPVGRLQKILIRNGLPSASVESEGRAAGELAGG